MMAEVLNRFIQAGWVNIMGGCCGTTPQYIGVFADLVQGKTPRKPPQYQKTLVSGIDFLEINEENRPILVGERTNAVGSRLFKRLIAEEQFEQASEIRPPSNQRGCPSDGCQPSPIQTEKKPMTYVAFLAQLIRKIKAPLMIDSTDVQVIAAALPYSQGKAIINSVNLEDGEERFEAVVPLAKKYGAALVVGNH